MKPFNLFYTVLPLCVVASCGGSDLKNDTSQTQSVEDMSSSQVRADGRYDVICKDGTREIVSSKDLVDNKVCLKKVPPTPTPTSKPSYVTFGITDVALNRNPSEFVLGFGLSGTAQFKLLGSNCGNYEKPVTVVDGVGTTWKVTGSEKIFTGVILPVKFSGEFGYICPTISAIQLTALQVNSALSATSGKFSTDVRQVNLGSIGEGLLGAPIAFDVVTKKYSNYVSGTGCFTFVLTDSKGTSVVVGDSVTSFKMVAPVRAYGVKSCESSPKPDPENATADVSLTFKNIQLGTPVP